MRMIVFALCLAGAVLAEEKKAVTLPVAKKGILDREEKGRIVVDLDAAGRIRYGKKAVTLDELKRIFDKAAAPEVGPGPVHNVAVLLRVDRNAPWQHVQWLMTTMAMSRLYRLQFAVKKDAGRKAPDAKLPAPLPIDKGPGARANQGLVTEVRVAIHIVARKEVVAKVNGVAVKKPTEFRFRFGDRESANLATVRKWCRDALKATAGLNVHVVGEIKAGHKVPHEQVMAVLGELHDVGLTNVAFYGTAIPGATINGAQHLPYPKKNYGK